MKRICLLLTNDYEHDSRVKKECFSLSTEYKVDLYCLTKNKSEIIKKNKNWNVYRLHFKYPLNKISIYYFSNNLFLENINKLNKKYDLIWANDIDTIKLGYMLKKKYLAKLIYDSHEYWNGMLGNDFSIIELYKRIYVHLFLKHEKKYISEADLVFTVNDLIRNELIKDYSLKNCQLLYNVPFKENIFSKQGKIDNSIVYVGKIGNYIKTIEILCENGFKIYHYGKNEKIENIKGYHYCGYIKETDIVKEISKYKVALSLYSGYRLNEKYASPNKFFQYILAGLPVLCNKNSVFMANIIKKYSIGENYINKNIVLNTKKIIKDYNYYNKNVLSIKNDFIWEKQEKKILNYFSKFFK